MLAVALGAESVGQLEPGGGAGIGGGLGGFGGAGAAEVA